jgi:probable F420-dependent oxidoreductase
MSRPELGVQVWSSDIGVLQARARQVEALGFDVVSVPDHLVDGLPPPLFACAVIASVTRRVRVATLVLNNDLRHPVLLARDAAMLSELSEGRFELGLGAGYARAEYERAGMRYDPGPVRVARLCESVQIVRRLLDGEEVTFAGEHYRVTGERCSPLPTARVPIVIGGNSAAIHACASDHADALGFVGFSTNAGGATMVVGDFTREAFERQLARLPTPSEPRVAALERHVLVQDFEITADRQAALSRLSVEYGLSVDDLASSPYVAVGSADEVAAQLSELHRSHGVTRFTIFSDKPEAPPLETLVPVLALFGVSVPG